MHSCIYSGCRCSAAAAAAQPTPASSSGGSSSSSGSLIPETLKALAADKEAQAVLAALQAKGQAQLTREEAKARKRSLKGLGLPGFTEKLKVLHNAAENCSRSFMMCSSASYWTIAAVVLQQDVAPDGSMCWSVM
jgi:hypothetical protein